MYLDDSTRKTGLLAFHAQISTQKRTLRAAQRCNSRRRRAVARLAHAEPIAVVFPIFGIEISVQEQEEGREAATAALRLFCQLCNLCPAYGIPLP